MLKVNRLYQFCIILLGLAIGVFFANQTSAEQVSDVKLIKIMPEFEGDNVKGFSVDPGVLNVKKNTIVLWMNGVLEQEVQVVFNEGKTCRDISANPNMKAPGFFLDARDCYVTSFLPYAGTSALQFIDAGKYEYKVVTEDGKMSAMGKIEVEK